VHAFLSATMGKDSLLLVEERGRETKALAGLISQIIFGKLALFFDT